MSSHYEGFSLASVEAMASGKPLIATNVSVLDEIVGNAGILFEKGNGKDLASKINELLNNEIYYTEVVKKCKKRAEDFDINKTIDKLITLYKSF